MSRRTRMLAGLDLSKTVGVEIGALDKPLVTRDMGEILYVDYTDAATLRERYQADTKVQKDAIVDIDGIWGDNSLSEAIGGRKVDYVLASHVIEHVPDLVTWLNELESVLLPGGQIRLAIPDMRYTFDCFRRETVFSDVLPAYIARARRPMPREIIDFICNFADVKTDLLWHQPAKAVGRKLYGAADAIQVVQASMRGEYHDVHCWTFTPASFARLMGEITAAGLSRLKCHSFSDTPTGKLEFCASLSVDPTGDILTWEQIERMARPHPVTDDESRPAFMRWHLLALLRSKVLQLATRFCPSLLQRVRRTLRG